MRRSGNDQQSGLDLGNATAIAPGQKVFVIGHPKESAKRYGHKGPPLELAAGTISDIGTDESGQPSIRVADAIHPLNVGGPVVSEQGKPLGVAVRDPSGDGFRLVTIGQIEQTLRGRLEKLSAAKVKEFGNGTAYRLKATVTDPRRHLKSIQVLAFDKSEQTVTEPDANGRWQQAAEKILTRVSAPVSLSRGILRPFNIGTDLMIQSDEDETLLQARFEYQDGSVTFFEPAALTKLESFQLSEDESRKASDSLADDHPFQELLMPQLATAIELRPDNGDVLGLGILKDEVFLMRAEMIASGDFSAAPVIPLDGPPLRATFKRFGDRNFWVVACFRSKNIQVIDADTFKMVRAIETNASSFSQNSMLSVSRNPEDPFVYYSSASDQFTGAVNLRTLTDVGQIAVPAKQFKVFADGKSAIGIASSSFQRWELTSAFVDDTPKFDPSNRLSRASFPFLLDPNGQYVFAGTNVLSQDFTKSVATLPTAVKFVLSKHAYIGVSGDKRYNRVDLDTLRFVSYNDFNPVDVSVKLPKRLAETQVQLTSEQRRGIDSGMQFQSNFYADEQNDRLLAATGDRLYTLSIGSLGLPKSPFLSLASPTTVAARVGLKNSIPVTPKDTGVEVTLQNPLPGMTFEAGAIQWTPTSLEVGLKSVPVQLRSADAQRTVDLTIDVAQPYIKSPVKISGVKMSDSGAFCVAWSGPQQDQYGRVVRVDGEAAGSTLALIPLRSGFQPKQTAVPFQIQDAILIGSKVVLQPTQDASRVEVYDLKTLERVKTLLSASNLLRISLEGDTLVLQGSKSVDRYNTRTFARLKPGGPTQAPIANQYTRSSPQSIGFLRDGTLENGILLDTAKKQPMLFVSPNRIPVIGAMDSRLASGSFLRRVSPQVAPTSARTTVQNLGMVGPKVMPERGWQVSLWPTDERIEYKVLGSRSFAMKLALVLVVVDQDGTLLGRYPIAEQIRDSNQRADKAFLQATKDAVFVMMGDKIYRWSATEAQTNAKTEGAEEVELYFVPKQDEFVMRSRDEKLRHQLVGGKAPYEFFLVTRSDAVTMDETDGTVKIDRDMVFNTAMPVLQAMVRREQTADAQMARLQRSAIDAAAQFRELTGSAPRGFPIVIPVHLKAVDAAGTVAQIQYFVLVDLTLKQIIGGLKASP